jgi:hypothetical protein
LEANFSLPARGNQQDELQILIEKQLNGMSRREMKGQNGSYLMLSGMNRKKIKNAIVNFKSKIRKILSFKLFFQMKSRKKLK